MNDPQSPPKANSSRIALYLIIGLPLLTIALSSVMYYLAERDLVELGTVNKGELIEPPAPLPDIDPVNHDHEPMEFGHAEASWLFLVVGGSRCEGACERMLYLTRQTRAGLGRRSEDIQRVYLSLEGTPEPALNELIEREHRDLKQAFAPRDAFRELLADSGFDPLAPNQFFVVDPHGWLMLRYQADSLELEPLTELGKDAIEDMRRLIQ